MTDAVELWTGCAERLRVLVGDATWLTWFDQVKPLALDDRVLRLSAPSSLVRSRLEDRYLGTIQDLATDMANRPLVVNLSVQTHMGTSESNIASPAMPAPAESLGWGEPWTESGQSGNGTYPSRCL